MSDRFAVVLAAGKGTRMKSKLYKVLHPVCGKAMVEHVVDALSALQVKDIVTVVGHGAQQVQDVLKGRSQFVNQNEQLGTAHAVLQTKDQLAGKKGVTLVVCGDTPLLTANTLESLFQKHDSTGAKATVLTAHTNAPEGYGRIVRNSDGIVERIVEHKDASPDERDICEINTGTYCFDNETLFELLEKVGNDNSQGEYYLPDVIELIQENGWKVAAQDAPTFSETIGINDRVALANAEHAMRERILTAHMRQGVTIIDPTSTYIGTDVTIGQDTTVYPGTSIHGATTIGEDCLIGPHTELQNAVIGNASTVKQSVMHDSQIGHNTTVGPYSHLRPGTDIGDACRVGNFVEMKKTSFGHGSKAPHLSYIGDAVIGEGVNLGCGSITVNYDGANKHQTTVEDGAFIGCNSNLVAPVTVGAGAFVAAGSTITEDVPANALSIARSRQVNKEEYNRKTK
ncbi:bifunctional UDP-N-acetylglucosamine diphosphorylase/glucosamine-1-phosphate N-acetyltransferase GlmU [Aureibacillus halotolerans]|uniref:Bifunctional protein GlmU n=1 Tax=Aureibacillus halotolerans TaxID=1508390 RepID=A0A4R6TTX9_9BACI|nr:bifunctional UDP-N-acetylglucosamine diphosphorylase/glucosamine-1-phosphate N-acetyltransferase GlmU [Aureibacillus halotolerans]TDQ34230.1 bifunctional UDP-N-acetylglucosamine pyrophosphorylase/glucosamine-1-phosphate N-acetyltransferase [Aureibacillus halotolerans]